MAAGFYPAIIERTGQGYSVFFPDLPGCTSAGDTVNEAAAAAEEALTAHLILSTEHGDAIANASQLSNIEHDADVDEVARMLVRGERPGRPYRVPASLDYGRVARADQAEQNRPGLLADAVAAAVEARLLELAVAPTSHRT